MKKNKILILLVSLFSIFVISDRVDALTYIANDNKEYNVNLNDSESFRDYCYFKFVKPDNKKNLIVYSYDSSFYCIYNSTSDFTIFGDSSTIDLYYDASPVNYLYSQYSYDGSLYLENISKSSFKSIYYNNIYYTNDDILIGGGNPGNFFDKNFTFDDIENKYISSVEPISEQPSNNDEDISNDFPITKNDFYTLLVLLGVSILIQIFRFVFPMKGGKNL